MPPYYCMQGIKISKSNFRIKNVSVLYEIYRETCKCLNTICKYGGRNETRSCKIYVWHENRLICNNIKFIPFLI